MTAPKIITLPAGTWPHPRIGEARRAGDPSWVEVSEDFADQMFEVMPPIYWRGGGPRGFFIGEPAAHDDRGVAVHTAIVKIGARWYAREVALDRIQLALADLQAALAAPGVAS